MKGTNKLLLNNTQMCAIVQEWWNAHTYSSLASIVTNVGFDMQEFVFEVTIIEEPKDQ
jgi:hypothetical protein